MGAWLMANTLGVRLPGLETLWPVIVLIFGLALLLQYFAGGRRREGLLFTGVAASLLGAFLLTLTLGLLAWRDLGRWWPVFVVIGGVAFLAQWLARPSERGLLVPAFLALLIGLAALALNLGLVRADVTEQAARWWPLLLILLGLGFLGNYVASGRRKE